MLLQALGEDDSDYEEVGDDVSPIANQQKAQDARAKKDKKPQIRKSDGLGTAQHNYAVNRKEINANWEREIDQQGPSMPLVWPFRLLLLPAVTRKSANFLVTEIAEFLCMA